MLHVQPVRRNKPRDRLLLATPLLLGSLVFLVLIAVDCGFCSLGARRLSCCWPFLVWPSAFLVFCWLFFIFGPEGVVVDDFLLQLDLAFASVILRRLLYSLSDDLSFRLLGF